MPETTQPTPRGKMTAIATIVNPLSVNHDKVMIFSSNKHYMLSLENRTIGGDFSFTMGEGTSTQSPLLAYPSQLTAMIYKDAVAVYGITGTEKEDLEVAQLSPVYQPDTNIKPTYGSLAGCVADDGEGYLYMLSDNEQGKSQLHEWKLSDKDDDKRPIAASAFYEKTNLFALFDPVLKLKWLVYQRDDNSISLWSFKNKKDCIISESKYRARKGTPLTACIVPADEATGRPARIYIYFVNEDNLLQSANSISGAELYFNSTDEKPSTVEGDQTVSAVSQLSVFLDYKESRNIVFGVKSGSKISPMHETWRTK
ncbi:hypothetical protein D7B24_007913 [Verticillium nonalfalfae]|uniref:BPP domain-containing protein n=1 Tax=Verticillium nonalfalfae TaxID=1051616 RepID=A0A3M9Y6X0_9PEZI|nr:uncharacterized protein D7B24_007913 [Verticillium nonalfalfae]RNJ55915.1 hypothetical protein D7B24_007913 [Verticillium nonalfalfae]